MNEKEKLFYEFLEERKSQVQAEVNELAAHDRTDESNILKAKFNIYDIAKAVLGASSKSSSEDKLKEAFLKTFGNISGQWERSLKQAKDHDDSYKILVEEAKISAVSEIIDKINELF